MPVSKHAIERYLDKKPVPIPPFKGMATDRLLRSIYDSTGQFFETKTEILPHQLEGIAFALYQRRSMLFYEPRMRKTSIALNWAEHLKRARLWRNKGLVIAHSPDGLPVWESESAMRCNLKVRIVHLDMGDFIEALEDDTDLIVIPWSGLQEMLSIEGRNKRGETKLYANTDLIEQIAEEFGLCVIDESHLCMHHNTLRFAIAECITRQAKFRLAMTGTPVGRDPYALWAQAFLVDRGETLGYNYYFFEQAFSGKPKDNWFTGRPVYKFDPDKLPVLENKISSLAMSYQRSEVEDQTVWSGVVSLHMTGDQLEAYKDVINKLVKLEHDSVEILSTFHRLRQVSSGYLPYIDNGGIERLVHFRRNPKLEWLNNLFSVPSDIQMVIFHDYRHSGELLCKMLTKHKIKHGWLYGGTRNSREVIEQFQTGETQVLVANAAKGGVGIDLRMADYLVYFESPVSPIVRKQSEDRPMARGEKPVDVDDLVCSGVEVRILEFIRQGRDLAAALSGRKARESLR